ncbi:DUF2066 domain-containing protein [Salinimonas marina]|uniref:DUF2066 domain-containing protein n=1 Tax=Salinimonas marina TaxID=2785918 RepID=A0A7S9E0N7_9ALTE|nr:DUF2066 domain-containing protein [Salinimonas marina]QPG06880.1 DUF2066 domain-containing protein [Salinimonas marina]
MHINTTVRFYAVYLRFIFLLLLSGVSINVHASSLIEVNRAAVEVTNQGPKERKRAQTEALRQVFVKMTGSPAVLSNAGVRQALGQASTYLVSYRYSQQPQRLVYEAEFARSALETVIRRENLPVWGPRRPDTLFWLASEQQSRRWILREDQPESVRHALNQASAQRGVPIALPLMDLTDNTSITVSDVWGQFAFALRSASARYNPDLILSARLSEKPEQRDNERLSTEQRLEEALAASNLAFGSEPGVDDNSAETADRQTPQAEPTAAKPVYAMPARSGEGEYALEWVLLEEGASQFGTVRADTPEKAVTQLVEHYADYLGQRFSVRFNGDNTTDNGLTISVANLDSLSHYVHAQEFLAQLSVVDSAVLVRQQGSVATFSLTLVGDRSDFFNALSFESQLRPVTDSFGQKLEGHNFYWKE